MDYKASIACNGYIPACQPWFSVDAMDNRYSVPEDRRQERQEDIAFCLHHCPFEDCKCDCCDGRGHIKAVKSKRIDISEIAALVADKKTNAEIMRITGLSRYLLKVTLKKIKLEEVK